MLNKKTLALGAFALILAGCGSSSGGSKSSSNASATTTSSAPSASSSPFLAKLSAVHKVGSTVPANGDVNPYGLVLVPSSVGSLHQGDLLVSNFNDKENEQGTGTTIEQVSPTGTASLFATVSAKSLPGSCPGGVGLTTALDILPGGYVVVGSLPTTNGKSATAQYGCMLVLDSSGKVIKTIANGNIQGPWDSTAVSEGSKTALYVSNALNGGAKKGLHTVNNSTVLRIDLESGEGQPPKVTSEQIVAKGIPWKDSPEALVVGPTGLAVGADGTLYIADTVANRVTAVTSAATRTSPAAKGGTTVTEGGHLKEPLGLILAPNGDILTTNAGDGNIVETTPKGEQVGVQTADVKTGAGSLFGIAVAPDGKSLYFVDDGENTLDLLQEGSSGTEEGAAGTASTSSTSSSASAPPAPSAAAETLKLEANAEGQLKFDKAAISAKAGKVSIAFTNASPIAHNLTIASSSGAVLGATPTFQGGSKTLSLTLKAGEYKFYCSVPGHRMAGMEGTLTVK